MNRNSKPQKKARQILSNSKKEIIVVVIIMVVIMASLLYISFLNIYEDPEPDIIYVDVHFSINVHNEATKWKGFSVRYHIEDDYFVHYGWIGNVTNAPTILYGNFTIDLSRVYARESYEIVLLLTGWETTLPNSTIPDWEYAYVPDQVFDVSTDNRVISTSFDVYD